MAVCAKTFALCSSEPYRGQFELAEPRVPVAPRNATAFDCTRSTVRSPRETKGLCYQDTTAPSAPGCGSDGCCPC